MRTKLLIGLMSALLPILRFVSRATPTDHALMWKKDGGW